MALTKITTGLVAANTLATANIADNSVDATKIASNSILTRHIDDDQITGDQLADNVSFWDIQKNKPNIMKTSGMNQAPAQNQLLLLGDSD